LSLKVFCYEPGCAGAWDSFVESSKNGTFILRRTYMDYHSDRFEDHSVIIERGGRICALLPAHQVADRICSHNGLTYGGFVIGPDMKTPTMLDVFEKVLEYYRDRGIESVLYKTIPHIYHRLPAEEDRFALFRRGARLIRRDVLSVIGMGHPPVIQDRRARGARKARAEKVSSGKDDDWAGYWAMLTGHLEQRFGVAPVHSLEEINHLRSLFPERIKLFGARNASGSLIAGTVIYETDLVAHVQYIASNDEGRKLAALDLLFTELVRDYCSTKPWFDFGPSNTPPGRDLNTGLIEQKEGFGGRAVMHDVYEVRA